MPTLSLIPGRAQCESVRFNYTKASKLRRLVNVFRWKFYNWIVCSLVPNRLPLTPETSARTCFARLRREWEKKKDPDGRRREGTEKCKSVNGIWQWKRRKWARTESMERQKEGERARETWGTRKPRLKRWWRKPLIQIVRSAGPTSEASIASGERILEIQWPPGICMDDRYANHGNLLKKYGEISSN